MEIPDVKIWLGLLGKLKINHKVNTIPPWQQRQNDNLTTLCGECLSLKINKMATLGCW